MRALVALALILPEIAVAAAPNTSFHGTWKEESGSTGLTATGADASSSYTTSLDVDSGSTLGHFTLRAGADRTQADYNRIILTDRAGNQTLLSDVFSSPEKTIRLGADVYAKDTVISADASHSAGPTPFPGYSSKLLARRTFLAEGGTAEVSVNRADHSQPFSYFVDPDTFVTRLRPARLIQDRAEVSWEQILSEVWKARASVFLVDQPGSRPSHRGAELSAARALGDSSALVGKLGVARERQSDSLYDDRGYFGASWGEIEYRWEPSFRWSLSAAVGTILETETARGRLPDHKVGTDTLGLAAVSHWKHGDIALNALGARSNTGYRTLLMGGSFAWNL